MEEHSAGGVIIKKIDSQWKILLLKDMNGNWTFPKGLIEPGEDEARAAKREIYEEVGLSFVTNRGPLEQIAYWYVRNGNKIHKTVDYFLFESTQDETLVPQTEEGITEVQWFDFGEAATIIGYPQTNRSLLEEAITLITTSN